MKLTKSAPAGKFPALAALLVLAGNSFAATVAAPAAGDLFLAFRAGGGQGAATSYIVNIGSDLTYRNAAAGSSFDVPGLGNTGADLIATYGSGWSSRADLHWGVFGARQSVNSTVYASREQDPAGSAVSAWPALTQTARNSTATSVIDVISGIGGFTGGEATANSAAAILQSNSGSEASYNKQVAAAGTTDFGSLSQWTGIEDDFGSGAGGTALNLFRIAGSDSTNLGTFTLSSGGILNFTAAVPEPGPTLLLAAAGLLALRRRRP
ncbi:MAG: PEP-CTERM sorting domain-containing protein [Verrucomicrobiota bacterium]